MQIIKYVTHWSYAGKGVKREELLSDFVLDIPYLMEHTGVVPPLQVLNEVLLTGGDTGGMGPGTTWKPFTISEADYAELVQVLLESNLPVLRAKHPYIRFEKLVIDSELDTAGDYDDWLRQSFRKYKRA